MNVNAIDLPVLPESGFLADVALCALEAVDVWQPAAPDVVNVRFDKDVSGQLRIAQSNTTLTGARPPSSRMRDTLDSFAWCAVATMAFRRILEELPEWDGASATCQLARHAAPRVIVDGAAVLPVGPRLLADRLLTNELADALLGADGDVRARQSALADELRDHAKSPWGYSQGDGILKIGAFREPATMVATYAGSESTWLWSWSNSTLDAHVVGNTADVKSDAAGMGALRRAGFFCDEAFALRLAAFAGTRLGARGVFPGRSGDMLAFFALGARRTT